MSEQLPERVQIPRARLHTSRSEQLRAAIYGDQYTIKELAEALGVKWSCPRKWCKSGG
jgi:hypothetical protein